MEFKNNHDFITLFENRLSEFTGAPYVVTTNSATSALMLSIKCLEHFGEIKNDFMLIPTHTYISVPQMLIHLGYKTYFEYMMWSEKYKLKGTNIWDCAVGFRQNMYEDGTIQCLSFQQKKCLNLGQGGAVLLDNKAHYEYIKRMSYDGRDASKPFNIEMDIYRDEIILESFHVYMTPDNCAKGVLLLNQLSEEDIVRKLGKYTDYPDVSVLEWQ